MLDDADYININHKQRAISAVTGLALIGAAIRDFRKNKPARRWVELGLGVLFVARGVSGFCPATKLAHAKA